MCPFARRLSQAVALQNRTAFYGKLVAMLLEALEEGVRPLVGANSVTEAPNIGPAGALLLGSAGLRISVWGATKDCGSQKSAAK